VANDVVGKRPKNLPPGVTVVDGTELHEDVRVLAHAANFAAVTTLLHDGRPQTQMTWVDVDDTHLLINTLPFTQKYRNSQRDQRITVLIWDRQDPEHYVEVRGHVDETVGGQAAVDHADRLAKRYVGMPYRGPTQRVVLRVQPSRQVVRRSPWA
jgi:PPOX class probable F420-dependent enzyme